MAELLIGCGNRREKEINFKEVPDDWVELITLDEDINCKPDVVHDLESLPLPFDDNMFDEIHAYDVLEHTGQQGDWRFFFGQFYEFWRILKPGGYFCGKVPAWDSIWAWGDPGHKRVISEANLAYLDRSQYELQVGINAMTDYRGIWAGDFEPIDYKYDGETMGFVIRARKDEQHANEQ